MNEFRYEDRRVFASCNAFILVMTVLQISHVVSFPYLEWREFRYE